MKINNSFWNRVNKLSVVRQTETSECGLACVAMILNNYRLEPISLSTLRGVYPSSSYGTRLISLIKILCNFGFQTKALRLEVSELKQLKLPCILHWNLNHFVILTAVKRSKFEIIDPATGRSVISIEKMSSHFTGVALESSPGQNFNPQISSSEKGYSWWRITAELRGFRGAILRSLVLAIFLELISLVQPMFARIVIDGVLVEHSHEMLLVIAALFYLMLVIGALFSSLRTWAIANIRADLAYYATSHVFSHLIKLPAEFFEKRRLGDVVSRFNSVNSIHQTFSSSLVESALDGIMAVLTLTLMLVYVPYLAWIPITALSLYSLSKFLLFKKYQEVSAKKVSVLARQQNRIMEAVKFSQTIRIANAHSIMNLRFNELAGDIGNASLNVQRFDIFSDFLNAILFGLERIAVMGLGAFAVYDNKLTPGTLVAFAFYSSQFSSRASNFLQYVVDVKLLKIQGARLADIVNNKCERNLVTEYSAGIVIAKICLSSVSFRYALDDNWILKNLELKVSPGEHIAIIGPSGAGKTTLIKLLLGIVEPSVGTLEVGDIEIGRLGKIAYRDMLGVALQDSEIFAGTIADNVSLFDPDPDFEWLIELMDIVSLKEDLRRMPLGFNTRLGSIDSFLSAGQKQRLIIARALYKRPKILIFDEATCHIDLSTENKIFENIKKLKITQITVTHRQETCVHMDKIYELNNGVVKLREAFVLRSA